MATTSETTVPTHETVLLTQQGVDRIPNGRPGETYRVESFTPTADDAGFVAHVHSETGSIWSLGVGDWEPGPTREEVVLAWRFQADERGNADLAAELEGRAAELRTPPLPEDERRISYADCWKTVTHGTFAATEASKQERIARRMHTHQRGSWHSAHVLYGHDGRGCPCGPCSTARGDR
jgi:hypothetical protein